MAIIKPQGQRVSPGVYRNPNGGALFKSQTGAIRIPKANAPAPQQAAPPAAGVPATGGGVTAVNNAGGPITNLNPMQDQRKRLAAEVQRRGGRANAQGFAKQLDALDAKIGAARKSNATGAAPPPPPAPDQTATIPPGETPTNVTDTLFPNTRMFEPENYEGSPLYQFQLKEGQKQVARSLAKRGLVNSGAGIEEELDVPMRAAAQDTDRMTRVASENADRLKSFMDNEALRKERVGNETWNRGFSLAELMAQQSPWSAALAGLNNTADLTSQAGKDQANFLRDFYAKSFGGGGGGGGGGSGTPLPLPAGPDYSNVNGVNIGSNYSSNKGWMNILSQGLANFFPSEPAKG